MVEEKLSTIFEFETAEFVLRNEEFDFSISLIRPENKNFCLLFTDGLSKYQQKVSQQWEDYKHIELYFCLPEYWNFLKDSWPVDWLEKIACIPQKNNTSLSPGDTISTGTPPKIIDLKMEDAGYFLISTPILLEKEFTGETWKDSPFHFAAAFPIFEAEFNYKMRHSGTSLINKLKEKGVTEKVDIYRKSVVRKKILGLF